MDRRKRIVAWVMIFLMLFGTLAFAVGSIVAGAEELTLVPRAAGDNSPVPLEEGGSGSSSASIPTEPTLWVEASETPIPKDEPVTITIRIVDPQVSKRPDSDGKVDFGDYLTTTTDADPGKEKNPSVTIPNMVSNGFTGPTEGTGEDAKIYSGKVTSVDSYDQGNISYLQYTVVLENVVYSNAESKLLKFKVEGGGDSTYSRSFSVDMEEFLTDYNPPVIVQPTPDDDEDTDSDDGDSGEDKPDIATAKPYVIVSSYDYGGGDVQAGSTFDLTITFYNTSRRVNVENMVMTVSTSEGLSITNSSNTFYIERLERRKSKTQTLNLRVQPGVEPGSQTVEISFKYQYVADDARSDLETSETIAIPVRQLDRFQVDPIEMVDQVMVGEDYTMTVTYMNKGRSEVYNLSAEIDAPIESPGQRQNIGNIQPGGSGEIDFDVQSMTAGPIEGKVILTYEDINMNVTTVEMPFSTEVVDPNAGMEFPIDDSMDGMDDIPMEPEESSPNWWIYLAIGAGVLAAIILLVVYKKRKAAKLLAELEDDDEDI